MYNRTISVGESITKNLNGLRNKSIRKPEKEGIQYYERLQGNRIIKRYNVGKTFVYNYERKLEKDILRDKNAEVHRNKLRRGRNLYLKNRMRKVRRQR